jgi:hypothetical protein
MADMIPQGTQEDSVPFGHEKADANVRVILISIIGILSTTAVAMLAMAGTFNYLNNREMAKDRMVPETFAVRQLPPGPPLLPSPQRDQLPWEAYHDERRAQESQAAQVGIINRETGNYQVPEPSGKQLSREQVTKEAEAYFQSKPHWDLRHNRWNVGSLGGVELADNQSRFGHNGTTATQPRRPGVDGREIREIGPEQVSRKEAQPHQGTEHAEGSH